MAQELHYSGSIFVHIGEANIAGLSHMVLQVLPRAGSRQSRNHDAELGSSSRRTAISPVSCASPSAALAITSTAAAVSTGSTAARKLHPQSVTVVVVAIASLHGIVSITGIFELYKSKWRPATVFQVNEGNFTELVKQILDILSAYIWWQVSNVDSALIATMRHVLLSVYYSKKCI